MRSPHPTLGAELSRVDRCSYMCFPSYVFTAAKLIAPVMDKKDWESGYDWVVETIKLDHEYLASKMEIEKALHYLKTKEFDKVIGHIPCVLSDLMTYQQANDMK